MTTAVIETVTFKLLIGVSDASFLANGPTIKAFLTRQPGFISRRLSKDENDVWLDHVEWATMDNALAAAEAFMQDKTLAAAMRDIDMQSIEMKHSQLLATLG